MSSTQKPSGQIAQNSMMRTLSSTLLFEGLKEEHLENLAQHARLQHYAAGDLIVRETDVARGFYMVVSGRVKVFKISPDGRDQTIYHFGPGEPFCLCALFENRSFLANAAALEDCEVLFIPAESLDRMAEDEPSLLFNLLFHLARRLKEALDLVETLSIRSLNERVALFLLKLVHTADASGNGPVAVRLPMTHRELAKIVGSSHEALSRAFRALSQQGVLTLSGRDVEIHDIGTLTHIAGATHS